MVQNDNLNNNSEVSITGHTISLDLKSSSLQITHDTLTNSFKFSLMLTDRATKTFLDPSPLSMK